MKEYLGGCEALKNRFKLTNQCCSSCHSDNNDLDISMCMISTYEGYYEVCCATHEEYKKLDKLSKED